MKMCFAASIRTEEREDLSDFDGDMVVVGTLAGMNTPQTPDLLLFSPRHPPL